MESSGGFATAPHQPPSTAPTILHRTPEEHRIIHHSHSPAQPVVFTHGGTVYSTHLSIPHLLSRVDIGRRLEQTPPIGSTHTHHICTRTLHTPPHHSIHRNHPPATLFIPSLRFVTPTANLPHNVVFVHLTHPPPPNLNPSQAYPIHLPTPPTFCLTHPCPLPALGVNHISWRHDFFGPCFFSLFILPSVRVHRCSFTYVGKRRGRYNQPNFHRPTHSPPPHCHQHPPPPRMPPPKVTSPSASNH